MLIEAAVAAALYNGTVSAERPNQIVQTPEPGVVETGACKLPALDQHSGLVVLRLSGGDSVSTVAVSGLDQPTEAGEIEIGRGSKKLNVVLETRSAMVVRFYGRVSRLNRVLVVSRAGAGVTGVPASKVRFRTGEKCRLPYSAEQVQKAFGRRPDVFWGEHDLYRGWTDGITFRHQEVVRSTDSRKPTYLEAQLNWLYPGGVTAIDPSTVVSSSKAEPYSVLPYAAGAVQLEREGVLVPVTPTEIEAWQERAKVRHGKRSVENLGIRGTPYRVTRPTRVPAGLCGSNSLTFFVPSREYLSGDWCHSTVLALDGRILAPSWYANDPDCGSTQFTAFAQPHASGPLRLQNIYCGVKYPASNDNDHQASPDARYMAFFPGSNLGKLSPIRVQEIIPGAASHELPLTGAPYSNRAFWQSVPPFAWRQDSQAIWGVKSLHIGESERSSLQPVLVRLDGSMDPLPELKHRAGPVEAMLWVGGKGRAIAQFRGDPFDSVTRKVLPPTYGMVDSKTGAVLNDFAPDAYQQLRRSEPKLKEFFYPNRVVATQEPEGSLHALMDFGQWVEWRESEEPRVIPNLPQASGAAMVGDGKLVLMLRPNLPGQDNLEYRVICEESDDDDTPCFDYEPSVGTWASLHDIETGRLLWTLAWTFDRHDELRDVALSPDGRLALIVLPSRTDRYKRLVAVVSMSNGKVVQTLPTPQSNFSMGFADGGKKAWIMSMRATTIYSVD